MNYKIVTGNSPSHLEEKVNEYIQKDWIPQGGVCALPFVDGAKGNIMKYSQAMIWKGK